MLVTTVARVTCCIYHLRIYGYSLATCQLLVVYLMEKPKTREQEDKSNDQGKPVTHQILNFFFSKCFPGLFRSRFLPF